MVVGGALVVASYLAGTLPTAVVVARRLGHDPTREGSGNPGASNVYRTAGRRAGALVLAGDLAKGAAAAGAGLAAGGRSLGLACGAAAVVGHVLPLTRGLRGGKGVATAAGMAVVLFPLVSAALVVGWLAVARLGGTASAASVAVAVGFPAGAAATGGPLAEVLVAAGVAGLVVVRHAGNIVRLVHGDERRLRAGQR